MKRRLVTLAAVASLVLCVATLTLWVRSYWSIDSLAWQPTPRSDLTRGSLWVATGNGGIRCSYSRAANWIMGRLVPPPPIRADGRRFWFGSGRPSYGRPTYPYALRETIVKGVGFELSEHRHAPAMNSVGSGLLYQINIVVPLWFPALLFACLPLTCAARLRTRGARSDVACCTCGYDLRATPERCPECGTAPSRHAAC